MRRYQPCEQAKKVWMWLGLRWKTARKVSVCKLEWKLGKKNPKLFPYGQEIDMDMPAFATRN